MKDITSTPDHNQAVKNYYHTFESLLAYRLMGGIKHCGYHPDPEHPLSLAAAQIAQDDLVAKTLDLKSKDAVLECGCGEGSAANYIAKHYGCTVTGIDILPENIARAQKQAQREQTNAAFIVGDYLDLPFPDNSFDAIYAMETLVHALDANKLFASMFGVLKPGGKLVFTEYSIPPRSTMSRKGQEIITIIDTACPMPALEQFTHGAFPKLLTKAGFTDITVEDITANIKPSVVKFHQMTGWAMPFIHAFGMDAKFVGTYAANMLYWSHMRGEDLMLYNLVTARKPE